MADTTHHQVLIIGGGTAGITVASSLRHRAGSGLEITIIEPFFPHDTDWTEPLVAQQA